MRCIVTLKRSEQLELSSYSSGRSPQMNAQRKDHLLIESVNEAIANFRAYIKKNRLYVRELTRPQKMHILVVECSVEAQRALQSCPDVMVIRHDEFMEEFHLELDQMSVPAAG